MQYISTRGGGEGCDFETALLCGPASDGGLLVPEKWPTIAEADLASMAELSYEATALRIMRPFIDDSFSDADLQNCLATAYRNFDVPERVVLTEIGSARWLLELFHGPTLAFKDLAMQLLSQLTDLALARRGQRATILGATSGDTGAAAVEAFRGKSAVRVFVLFPAGRVSAVQQRQMTTVADANIHAIAVRGDFDDAQALVKAAFADPQFRTAQSLVAINSINWVRILAQAVYYVFAGLRLRARKKPLRFVVPTGNFGDAFAGYVAQRIGLPVERFVVATNTNDILHQILATRHGVRKPVVPTTSPAMDIQVASNFERALFEATERQGHVVATRMEDFAATGRLNLGATEQAYLRQYFVSARADEGAVAAAMQRVWREFGILIDPHTAVGVHAAEQAHGDGDCVVLSTAHPAKFPEAVVAATGEDVVPPARIAALMDKPERCTTINPSLAELKQLIEGDVDGL